MPEWVPFSASEECQLCKADFSWASTSRSEVYMMRIMLYLFKTFTTIFAYTQIVTVCLIHATCSYNTFFCYALRFSFPGKKLRAQAQRSRDKHNCRMCGLLVCDPCSQHRKPMPRVGVLDQCRVCDRCFYGADPSRLA